MEHLLMTLRIRPPRIVVLINQSANSVDYLRVVRFFSQIWGGRFNLILPVDPDTPDPLTSFRLLSSRPEFVYGVGINEATWGKEVYNSCQPRQFALLRDDVAENIQRAMHEGFVRGDRALVAMFMSRNERSPHNRPLTVVSADKGSSLHAFCAAMFGMHHATLLDQYREETREFSSEDTTDFIDLCIDFTKNNWQTWLDATSFGLASHHMSSPSVDPTIVLVDNLVTDMSLFWNKRISNDHDEPSWLLPIPFAESSKSVVMDRLVEWLKQFHPISNYCVVTSNSVCEADCVAFAEQLKPLLIGTSIEYVDYERPRNRLPLVVPFESNLTWPVTLDGRRLQLIPPTPSVFDVGGSDRLYLDLINDASTRRALLEMQLPDSMIMPEILNGPCPPGFEHSVIKRFGDGVDSINARYKADKKALTLYVPTPEEVLEELVREAGYEILHDEKRSSYLPTIDRFGSIHEAATALKGKPGAVIQALADKGTLLPCRIRGFCGLGKGELPLQDYARRINDMAKSESDRTKRIAVRRFQEYAHGKVPESLTLGALLEHWSDNSILDRCWEIGPCSVCHQRNFVKELSIQEQILCPNCGNRVTLREQVRIGYSLNPTVKHSLDEGLAPVVLAGRFLRNMTNSGFFWLPGLKYRKNDINGDLDILACCDGHLVFAECKTLVEVSAGATVWEAIKAQFLDLAEVAIECGATLAVLAARVDEYPDNFTREIKLVLQDRVSCLFLNSSDLESGHRMLEKGRWLSMRDLVPVQFPDVPVQREGGQRKINFGGMTHTKGG